MNLDRSAAKRLHEVIPNRDGLNSADMATCALLLIDVINAFQFDGAESLLPYALPMAARLAGLKQRAKAAGLPVIYANDNFGRWRSDFPKLVQYCLRQDVPGRPIVEQLVPEENDYFILKPKHSAFFHTNLDSLLDHLSVTTLILTGIAGDICVLFTANDAYMRGLHLIVPSDCVASEDPNYNRQALTLMQRVLKARIFSSVQLKLPSAAPREEITARNTVADISDRGGLDVATFKIM